MGWKRCGVVLLGDDGCCIVIGVVFVDVDLFWVEIQYVGLCDDGVKGGEVIFDVDWEVMFWCQMIIDCDDCVVVVMCQLLVNVFVGFE